MPACAIAIYILSAEMNASIDVDDDTWAIYSMRKEENNAKKKKRNF